VTKTLRCVALTATLAVATACALAQEAPGNAQTLRARSLAATCAACHGTDGRATPGAALPGLAAMPATYLVEQMKSFRSGARPGTVMPQLAKGYSDAQIEQLGAWFAQVPANAPRK
jgi:cytochrome c553